VSEPGPRVALTFDAEHPDRPRCPPDAAERILAALREAGARATFFIQGRWALSQPALARGIAEDGHLIGHHSHHHARMTLLTDRGLREDVAEGERAIRQSTGADPRPWFRCPFGDGHDDPRVLQALGELGYRNVHWHVEVEDWEPWRTPEDLTRGVLEGVRRHGDGTVVLLHTWPAPTAEALPDLLTELERAGARPVRIDELEALP
jgi:peptidoglycan/xylan/chitin deacetylase (PgdA/CDA1 family)